MGTVGMVGTTPVARASTPVRSFMPARHENTPVAGNLQWDCVIVRSLTHCIARHRVSADSGPELSTHTRCVQGTQGGLEGAVTRLTGAGILVVGLLADPWHVAAQGTSGSIAAAVRGQTGPGVPAGTVEAASPC